MDALFETSRKSQRWFERVPTDLLDQEAWNVRSLAEELLRRTEKLEEEKIKKIENSFLASVYSLIKTAGLKRL
ncbi:MAG: hypothetical protein HC867_08950 [Bacteroidia bacterium]|nr:hypothetical protein [Bacteroidia bacterium]